MDSSHPEVETNTLLSSMIDTRSFSSGEKIIDDFFHDKAEQSDTEFHTQTTLMTVKYKVIGFYSSSVRTFEIRNPDFQSFTEEGMLCSEDLENMEAGDRLIYPAINLDYFAIAREYQRIGYGRIMMRMFLSDVASAYLDHGIGFGGIVLHALPDAVIFYEKAGFIILDGIDFENGPDLKQYPMFISTQKVLDYYCAVE